MALAPLPCAGEGGLRLISSGEMAKFAQCSVRSLHRWRKDGTLTAGVYHSKKHAKGRKAKGGYLRYDRVKVMAQLGQPL